MTNREALRAESNQIMVQIFRDAAVTATLRVHYELTTPGPASETITLYARAAGIPFDTAKTQVIEEVNLIIRAADRDMKDRIRGAMRRHMPGWIG